MIEGKFSKEFSSSACTWQQGDAGGRDTICRAHQMGVSKNQRPSSKHQAVWRLLEVYPQKGPPQGSAFRSKLVRPPGLLASVPLSTREGRRTEPTSSYVGDGACGMSHALARLAHWIPLRAGLYEARCRPNRGHAAAR